MLEIAIAFIKTYGVYIGGAIGAVVLYLWDRHKAVNLLKELMLAAARLMRKGYLESTDDMKQWVVSKYDLLPAWIRLVVSRDAWSKLVDLIADKVKEYCEEDEILGVGEIIR